MRVYELHVSYCIEYTLFLVLNGLHIFSHSPFLLNHSSPIPTGRILVDHYTHTSLHLLLPAVENGLLTDNWRIRQSSVKLLGKLLFKVGYWLHLLA